MANTKEIKRRIRSVKNIGQVTKAVQLVSAVKMKKAQAQLQNASAYNAEIRKIFHALWRQIDPSLVAQYLGEEKKEKTIALVIIAPTKGLAGAINTNLARSTLDYTRSLKEEGGKKINFKLITVEKKSKDFAPRLGYDILADFEKLSSVPSFADTAPIAQILMDEFSKKTIDEVHIVYTKFVSTFIQKATAEKIFPVIEEHDEEEIETASNYEPSADQILTNFLPLYIKTEIYHGILEAMASEHSARMIAMQNATDNAKSLRDQLVLEYNKTRQAAVTQEILEIVSSEI